MQIRLQLHRYYHLAFHYNINTIVSIFCFFRYSKKLIVDVKKPVIFVHVHFFPFQVNFLTYSFMYVYLFV